MSADLKLIDLLSDMPASDARDRLLASELRRAADEWAKHFASEVEAEYASKRAACSEHMSRHVAMRNGPKRHGGSCAHCRAPLPKWKSFAYFNTIERKLVCHECYTAEESRLHNEAFPEWACVPGFRW